MSGSEMNIKTQHTLQRRTRMWLASVGLTLCAVSPGQAQTASVSAEMTVSARALAAIEVPHAAIELRASGVPEPEVRTALVAVHEYHVPAPEVHVMLTHSARQVHAHGPIPNFGHFVEIRLGEGLRGPRLYQTIRVEHQEHRRGPPAHAVAHGRRGHRGRANVDIRVKHHGPKVHVKHHGPKVHVKHHGPKVHAKVSVRGGGRGKGKK